MEDEVRLETASSSAAPVVPRSTNRMKLSCPVCAREFTRAEHLGRHIRSHTKEKPFVCSDCGKQYTRFDVLVRHRRNAPNHSGSSVSKDNARTSSSREQRRVLTKPPGHGESLDTSGAATQVDHENSGFPSQQRVLPAVQSTHAQSFSSEVNAVHDPETYLESAYGQDPGSIDFGTIENEWNAGSTLFESTELGPSQLLPDWDLDETLYATLFELPQLPDIEADVSAPSQTPKDQQHAETVRDLWFTRSPAITITTAPESHSEITSGIASPQPTSSELNDHQRSRLQKRLEIRSFESPVPSTEFLNTCIRLYFSRSQAVFPVVHPATFQPSKARAAVTLAVCVMGTLYMGSEQALSVGVRLLERLQKATLLYWEKAKMDDPTELTAIIQGAVLAQVFSHLSGIPNLLMAADSFHGPPISWARHQNLFGVRHSVDVTVDSTEEALQQAWREWARNEEYIRTSHALSIVDAELATLLHHEPIMRLNCRKLTPTSSERLFMASKASDWRAQWFSERYNWTVYRGEGLAAPSVMSLDISKIPQTSMFTAYAVLQELRMRVLAIKADKYQTSAFLEPIHTQLRAFARQFLPVPSQKEHDSLALRILWHSAFISVYADLDLLEKRIGRDGASFTKEESAQVSDWAESDDARGAVAHALLVKRLVESMTILHEPAIHVPRSLFSAGVTLFCYGKFASLQQKAKLAVPHEALPEIKLLNENMTSLLREGCEPAPGVLMFEKSLYVIVELLRRVGSWGLSRSFATILGTMTTQESGHS